MDQRKLYEPIRKWLESKGVKVMRRSEKMPVSVGDLFPAQVFIHPDIIGIKETSHVVVVEVETNVGKMLEVMGKCMLWKIVATYVYIAYPKEVCQKFKVLEKFGVGLLSVSEAGVEELIGTLSSEKPSDQLRKLIELYPVDYVRQSAGSWQRTVDAIKLFVEEGTLLRVVMNVFPGNKDDVENNLLLVKDLGAKVFSPAPVQPLGRGADVGWEKVSKGEMRKYRLKWREVVKRYKDFLLLIPPRMFMEMLRGINCGAGHRSWVIGPSGYVRPCLMMPEGLISLGNVVSEDIESIGSNPFIDFLYGVKPPGSFPLCDFCRYNVFCPFCLYRAICAGQENDECELWRDPTLGAHVNTSYLGRYSCSMVHAMFQR